MRVALWNIGDPVGVVESSGEDFIIYDPELVPLTGTMATYVKEMLSTVGEFYREAGLAKTNDDILNLLVERGAGYWEAKPLPER